MSEATGQATPCLGPYYEMGYLISNYYIDGIIGRQMEIIEALNLPEKQEVSVKNLLKKAVYEVHQSETINIDSELNSELREANMYLQREASKEQKLYAGLGWKGFKNWLKLQDCNCDKPGHGHPIG